MESSPNALVSLLPEQPSPATANPVAATLIPPQVATTISATQTKTITAPAVAVEISHIQAHGKRQQQAELQPDPSTKQPQAERIPAVPLQPVQETKPVVSPEEPTHWVLHSAVRETPEPSPSNTELNVPTQAPEYEQEVAWKPVLPQTPELNDSLFQGRPTSVSQVTHFQDFRISVVPARTAEKVPMHFAPQRTNNDVRPVPDPVKQTEQSSNATQSIPRETPVISTHASKATLNATRDPGQCTVISPEEQVDVIPQQPVQVHSTETLRHLSATPVTKEPELPESQKRSQPPTSACASTPAAPKRLSNIHKITPAEPAQSESRAVEQPEQLPVQTAAVRTQDPGPSLTLPLAVPSPTADNPQSQAQQPTPAPLSEGPTPDLPGLTNSGARLNTTRKQPAPVPYNSAAHKRQIEPVPQVAKGETVSVTTPERPQQAPPQPAPPQQAAPPAAEKNNATPSRQEAANTPDLPVTNTDSATPSPHMERAVDLKLTPINANATEDKKPNPIPEPVLPHLYEVTKDHPTSPVQAVTFPQAAAAIPVPQVEAASPKPPAPLPDLPAKAPALTEPLVPEKITAPAPMKSLSLEFTPDGARDVRIHISQNAGDVHVSLHSSDPNLAGKLRDGVQDLTGGLANAGYQAEEWTQHDQQRQRQPKEEQTPPAKSKKEAGDPDFSDLLGSQS